MKDCTTKRDIQIIEMRVSGKSYEEIAELFDITPSTASNIAKRQIKKLASIEATSQLAAQRLDAELNEERNHAERLSALLKQTLIDRKESEKQLVAKFKKEVKELQRELVTAKKQLTIFKYESDDLKLAAEQWKTRALQRR